MHYYYKHPWNLGVAVLIANMSSYSFLMFSRIVFECRPRSVASTHEGPGSVPTLKTEKWPDKPLTWCSYVNAQEFPQSIESSPPFENHQMVVVGSFPLMKAAQCGHFRVWFRKDWRARSVFRHCTLSSKHRIRDCILDPTKHAIYWSLARALMLWF